MQEVGTTRGQSGQGGGEVRVGREQLRLHVPVLALQRLVLRVQLVGGVLRVGVVQINERESARGENKSRRQCGRPHSGSQVSWDADRTRPRGRRPLRDRPRRGVENRRGRGPQRRFGLGNGGSQGGRGGAR